MYIFANSHATLKGGFFLPTIFVKHVFVYGHLKIVLRGSVDFYLSCDYNFLASNGPFKPFYRLYFPKEIAITVCL